MAEPLHVASSPCTSCPYRKDTPPGVWHRSEYTKLPGYDDPQTAYEVFLCHHSATADRQAVCRGWLTVHAESIAARLGEARGLYTGDQRYAPVKEELYGSGAEACAAGVVKPSQVAPPAVKVIQRLKAERLRSRARKREKQLRKRRRK